MRGKKAKALRQMCKEYNKDRRFYRWLKKRYNSSDRGLRTQSHLNVLGGMILEHQQRGAENENQSQ